MLEGLPQAPDYLDMLRAVRDRTLATDRRNGHLIPELFREITLRFSAEKALGQDDNPAHWEVWSSPTVTVLR